MSTIDKQDIVNLLAIVETASTRGAFRANELSRVGATYDKVLAAITAEQAETQEKED